MDDKQQNFYKRLLINIRVKCLKQGIKKSELCLKQGRKISDICLKQGQGMRGRAAPPHPEIYRVPPPPPGPLIQVLSGYFFKEPNKISNPSDANFKGSDNKHLAVSTSFPGLFPMKLGGEICPSKGG